MSSMPAGACRPYRFAILGCVAGTLAFGQLITRASDNPPASTNGAMVTGAQPTNGQQMNGRSGRSGAPPRVQADKGHPTAPANNEQPEDSRFAPAVWRRTGPGIDALASRMNALTVDVSGKQQLIADELGGYFFEFSWDAAASRLVIEVDGEPLDDLPEFEDIKGRLAFQRAATDRHPELEGFLTLDQDGQTVLIEVTVDGQHTRFARTIQPEAQAPVAPSVMAADGARAQNANGRDNTAAAEAGSVRWYDATMWHEAGPGRTFIETTLNGSVSAPSHVRTLWEGTMNRFWIAFLWDAEISDLVVEVDGELLDGLLVFEDGDGRLAFERAPTDRHPGLEGFLTLDQNAAFVGIEITVDDRSYRLRRPLFSKAAASGGGSQVPADTNGCSNKSSCVCFGKGAATGTCSSSDCDNGKKCGKNRACRWKAGCVE